MTGPEHYTLAEESLRAAQFAEIEENWPAATALAVTAVAHALLALAAVERAEQTP